MITPLYVYLFSTVGWHLCEKAKIVLWPLLQHYQIHLTEIDIADDDKLIEYYGTRIPVLGTLESGQKLRSPMEPRVLELNWPFTSEQVDAFFAQLSKS